jgi:hypothetical protein
MLAFQRLRMLWGALDWQNGTDNPYPSASTFSGGASAAGGAGSIGVRRATLVLDRLTQTPAADSIEMHFDFLNYTSGSPDDSWITSDFTTLEGYLNTWWASLTGYVDSKTRLAEIRWYRYGPGIVPPNPAVRVLTIGSPVAGSGIGYHTPQTACSITFRTAVRRSWGRTYLPWTGAALGSTLRPGNADCDAIANATQTLVNSAAGADFQLVVVSKRLSASLAVEKIEVDNTLDVIRRRRFKTSSYKKILP